MDVVLNEPCILSSKSSPCLGWDLQMYIGIQEKTSHKNASVEKNPQEKNPKMFPMGKNPHPILGPVEKTPHPILRPLEKNTSTL